MCIRFCFIKPGVTASQCVDHVGAVCFAGEARHRQTPADPRRAAPLPCFRIADMQARLTYGSRLSVAQNRKLVHLFLDLHATLKNHKWSSRCPFLVN